MSLSLRRLALIGCTLLLAALPPLAHAATPSASRSFPPSWDLRLWPALPAPGPHFLYVDDGGVVRNSLSGYQITRQGLVPTPGSPYPTGGFFNGGGAGTNKIATTAANGPCLFHTDQQLGPSAGQVESFQVNPATGALTAVSIVPLPGNEGNAGDVHVSADGRFVYVASWAQISGVFSLDALTVGPGCTLSLASIVYPQGGYYSITLVGSAGLLGVNTYPGTLDLYRITHGTQLSLVTATPSQIAEPLGAASGVVGRQAAIFSGTNATQGPSEAEAYTVNGQGVLGNVPGSPAVDGSSVGGAWVWFDPVHQQLIESEQYSGRLGIYGQKGGAFAFLSHTAPFDGGTGPMAQLGSVLFVGNYAVHACMLAFGSAICYLALQLPYPGGPGIGVL
jgi:hypothetical protein